MKELSPLNKSILSKYRKITNFIGVIVCLVMVTLLVVTVSYLPEFGSRNDPAVNEVVERYNTKELEESGATNIIAGIILDYRAFDTFGESTVLFSALCCVIFLLQKDEEDILKAIESGRKYEGHNDPIYFSICKIVVPIIWLFGIYVVLNGHLSAGGGFAGGAIIGAGIILFDKAFSPVTVRKYLTPSRFKVIMALAILLYGVLKSYSFYTGGNNIESIIPLGTPGSIFSAGLILPLNIAVGIVVSLTVYGFYALFTRGGI